LIVDNVFHSAFGGTFLNHMYLVAGRAPYFPLAPQSARAQFVNGVFQSDGTLTPDGYVVNSAVSVNFQNCGPNFANLTVIDSLGYETIGDLLTEANVIWAWYASGFANASAGGSAPFQCDQQPFLYFERFKDLTSLDSRTHLKDENDFFNNLAAGTLPSVSFVKPSPLANFDSEANISDPVLTGMAEIQRYANALMASPIWNQSALIITFASNGGRFDHVSPPKKDMFGPGTRIPTLVVSPHVKKPASQILKSANYETLSITKFIQDHYQVSGSVIPASRGNVPSLRDAFQFPPQPAGTTGFVSTSTTAAPPQQVSSPQISESTKTLNKIIVCLVFAFFLITLFIVAYYVGKMQVTRALLNQENS